jgi:hypothetical protein
MRACCHRGMHVALACSSFLAITSYPMHLLVRAQVLLNGHIPLGHVDLLVANGVVHAIRRVLHPPEASFMAHMAEATGDPGPLDEEAHAILRMLQDVA